VEIWGVFRDKLEKIFLKLSLLEQISGNFNSLISRENSLLFLRRDGPSRRAKHSEMCSMRAAPYAQTEPKTSKFPVNSLLAGNF
jgi:hypothetical protein